MSEFADVVRARRMTRAFRPDPIPPGMLENLVELASRAPSAGKTQGWHLLVLEGAATTRFWDVTLPPARRATFAWPGLLDAPVVALALADPHAYLERYSRADKARSGLGQDVTAWPAPYWTIDAAMALNTLLLAAESVGLGALLFGVFDGEEQLRADLGVPEHLQLLGAVALGRAADGIDSAPQMSHRPRRRSTGQIIHRDGWTDDGAGPSSGG